MEPKMSERGDDLPLSSALLQCAVWLRANHPDGSFEREVADVCWQAHEVIDEPAMGSPVDNHLIDMGPHLIKACKEQRKRIAELEAALDLAMSVWDYDYREHASVMAAYKSIEPVWKTIPQVRDRIKISGEK
jgi:hypothetical protein